MWKNINIDLFIIRFEGQDWCFSDHHPGSPPGMEGEG